MLVSSVVLVRKLDSGGRLVIDIVLIRNSMVGVFLFGIGVIIFLWLLVLLWW